MCEKHQEEGEGSHKYDQTGGNINYRDGVGSRAETEIHPITRTKIRFEVKRETNSEVTLEKKKKNKGSPAFHQEGQWGDAPMGWASVHLLKAAQALHETGSNS